MSFIDLSGVVQSRIGCYTVKGLFADSEHESRLSIFFIHDGPGDVNAS